MNVNRARLNDHTRLHGGESANTRRVLALEIVDLLESLSCNVTEFSCFDM